MSKRIPLTQGKYAIVDDQLFDWLNQYKWSARKDGNTYYAVREIKKANGRKTTQLMHRIILNVPKSLQTDHIDGNGLDNRQCNLRMCNSRQNNQHRQSHRNSSSKYKGVSFYKPTKRWQVYIYHNNKNIFLGHYSNEINAAKAYDQKSRELFGEFAYANF